MESIKINKVTPLQDLDLLIEFNNGIHKKYSVDLLFKQFPEYRVLEHKPLFDSVYVDCGGYSVAWTPDIDISEWELWDNGVSVQTAL